MKRKSKSGSVTLKIGNMSYSWQRPDAGREDQIYDIRDYGKPGFLLACSSDNIKSLLLQLADRGAHEGEAAIADDGIIDSTEGFALAAKILAKDVLARESVDDFVDTYCIVAGTYYCQGCTQDGRQQPDFDDSLILAAVQDDSLRSYLPVIRQAVKDHIDWLTSLPQSLVNQTDARLAELEVIIENYRQYSFAYLLMAVYYSAKINDIADFTNANDKAVKALLSTLSHVGETKQLQLTDRSCGYWYPQLLHSKIMFLEVSTRLFAALTDEQVKLKKIHDLKNSMVEKYAHEWTYLLIPKNIFESVKALGEDYPEEFYHILLHVYNNEFLLKRFSHMLTLRHSNRINELKSYIMEGYAGDVEIQERYGIEYFIGYALQLVVLRLLFDAQPRFTAIRAEFEKAGYNFKELRYSFYQNVFGKRQNPLMWFSQEVYPVTFGASPVWQQVTLHPAAATAAFLIEILAELTVNAVTYGLQTRDGLINICLDTANIDDRDFLTICYTNKTAHKTVGRGRGLAVLNELLLMTNSDLLGDNTVNDYVETKLDHSLFTVVVNIAEELVLN